ncbi:Hermansky-Pudlak syndrome 5 protein isoform X2 [Trichomycterus rosablanca]|uniref:Hermansky-Pudlak syndrome 5 protein isoform X2 n=1 Tax=Trichomycterus rosablanca TaxID=2290929 RepID=UPI002F3519AB
MIPVVPEQFTHVLAEFDSLDPLLSALRLDSGRLKCTCLEVSRKWLALGTSAGGLHLIQRDGWKQRLILTHKEGSLTQIACCPHDDDFIAVATSEGLVVVWELQLERRGRPERACVSWEHRGQAITALCWDTVATRVFIGDAAGKVSFIRAGSSKLGKGSGFVIFPVQTITTVDSRVVQLGYLEGRLLVSSLTRCYLCDTEREKFWRVGNKERDGEYGACFLPQQQAGSKGPGTATGSGHLLYCARPGSRIWEANFNGEVLSTHQFKQLLAFPALPLISYKSEPQYNLAQKSPQSLAFPRLLHLSDQNLLTWTDSAIYIFTPQNGQVLLWTRIKDIVDLAVFRNELFCLHGDGHLFHLSLLPADRCVERLIKRESWTLATTVTCMFQHAIITSRARKSVSVDRLEHLKAQLNSTSQQELIGQLDEIISKLEPLDSACSSRRSSISSHGSFNVLDCGIYRVISRRGSQSDEDTSSLVSQSMLEERMKEFNFAQEEEQGEHDTQSCAHVEEDKSDLLQFHLPLSFRPKPPRVALQAVKDSVSSFVKKTTEKINNLQMNTDLWPRLDQKEGVQGDVTSSAILSSDEVDNEETEHVEKDLQELRAATEKAILQIQDPLVLLDPGSLSKVLLEWVPVLERVLCPEEHARGERESEVDRHDKKSLEIQDEVTSTQSSSTPHQSDNVVNYQQESDPTLALVVGESPKDNKLSFTPLVTVPSPAIVAPVEQPLPSDLQEDLCQLACLYLDIGCPGGAGDREVEKVCVFLLKFFYLLDKDRVRRMCMLRYREQPDVLKAYIACMLEFTKASKVVEVIQKGDLLKSLRSLRELQSWNAPMLLAHLYRLYEKHGEMAVRAYPQFYPTVLPSDIMAMVQPNHFLPYLDNLVQSQAEEQRLLFLGSLLQPETLRQDWLELALSHDAPRKDDTITEEGHPKWHSHFFRWGYGRLLFLLIRLPADLHSKQKILESCRNNGYWTGYLHLCKELQLREEAFTAICKLDDMSLLEEPNEIFKWIEIRTICRPCH